MYFTDGVNPFDAMLVAETAVDADIAVFRVGGLFVLVTTTGSVVLEICTDTIDGPAGCVYTI